MSSAITLALITSVLKLAPEIVSIIEGIVGHGNPIAPEKLPQILTQATEVLSKATSSISSCDAITPNSSSDHSSASPSQVPLP